MVRKFGFALFIAVAIIGLARWSQQPREFSLIVDNQSGRMVEQVRLFGPALLQDAVLNTLEPGQQKTLVTAIQASGALRFEVSQDNNRIDTYIVEDTKILDDLRQRLTIHTNNRFILNREEAGE